MNDDGKLRDFAEVWAAANRSRALSLVRFVSTMGAALARRWELYRGNAAERTMPMQVPTRSDMAIAERSSGGK